MRGERRTCKVIGILGLTLALVMLSGSAQARMWVGAQIGANFAASQDVTMNDTGDVVVWKNARVEPAVIAGLTIGYDFVREGFLGYNYPDWMKYFSFAVDFTYNRYDMREQFLSGTINGDLGKISFPDINNLDGARVEGTMAVLSFLFFGKYGFFPDAEVPFGRLQPYLGVGPGIMFSSVDGFKDVGGLGLGSASSVDIALVTEAGVRYMALKNVSLDLGFRYRYGAPSYSITGAAFPGQTVNIKFDTHQFSALFRVGYHF
ncbi:MAG: hypothetical protein FJ134_16135 [Deltaproteobacteria bacterium]|nr:hypothetical protein [Deltaproteobacteria bacterium]